MGSEFRFNPIIGEWVLFAPHRQERPFQSSRRCPFCKGSDEVPNEFFCLYLPNKYPSLDLAFEDTTFDSNKPGKGICEVIVYTPNHEKQLWELSEHDVRKIIRSWIDRFKEIKSNSMMKYVYIFENSGIEIGVSLNHPHGQLYAFSLIPPILARKMQQFEHQPTCVLCSTEPGHRIFITSSFKILVPSFAKWPYELLIAPVRHISTIDDLQAHEIDDLAKVIKIGLHSISLLFKKTVPYIMAINQAPHQEENYQKFHFHIEIHTPMRTSEQKKFHAGVELGTGIIINPKSPEQAAREFIKVLEKGTLSE
jgi:UDPglucose--hexose-1-phosphate uridylyltransferase